MERNEVGVHEVRVYRALLNADKWLTSSDIAVAADVAPRLLALTHSSLCSSASWIRLKCSPVIGTVLQTPQRSRNRSYVDRLVHSAEVLGVDLSQAGA